MHSKKKGAGKAQHHKQKLCPEFVAQIRTGACRDGRAVL